MIMKNLIFALVAFLSLAGLDASAKSQRETNFTNQVLNFLKEEGYMPSLDSDGDVKFKSQGDTYFVVASDYDDGCYVKVMGIMGAEDVNVRAVLEACNATVAEYKFVRCYYNSSSQAIVYECAGFFTGIQQFKEIFADYLNILRSADEMLQTKYSEFS